MARSQDIFASPRTYTYAAIAVTNSIVTSIATAITQQTYSGAGLTGALAGTLPFPQIVTASTTSHSGSYIITLPITVTGTDVSGAALTDTITLTQVNGNETVKTTKAFKTITSIVVPPMTDTSGAFTFGTGDLLFLTGNEPRQIRAGAAGNLKMAYQDGTIDTAPALQGERYDCLPTRIYDSGTTALPITVFA